MVAFFYFRTDEYRKPFGRDKPLSMKQLQIIAYVVMCQVCCDRYITTP
jgi:hypothetical protein